jgi:hypothetical protein
MPLRVLRETLWAMNGTIEAVQSGAAGEPFGVGAGSLQTRYPNARNRWIETDDSRANLSSAALSMMPGSNDGPASAALSDNGSKIEELEARTHELRASSERGLASSKQVSAVSATLSAEVKSAAYSFAVGTLVSEMRDRSSGIPQRIAAAPDIAAVRASRGVEHLTASDTMPAEGEIHEKATAKVLPVPPNEEADWVATTSAPGNSVDEVELFQVRMDHSYDCRDSSIHTRIQEGKWAS